MYGLIAVVLWIGDVSRRQCCADSVVLVAGIKHGVLVTVIHDQIHDRTRHAIVRFERHPERVVESAGPSQVKLDCKVASSRASGFLDGRRWTGMGSDGAMLASLRRTQLMSGGLI